jgi:hypothetical protein
MVLARDLTLTICFRTFKAGAHLFHERNFLKHNAEVYVEFLNLNADIYVFLDKYRLLYQFQGAKPALGVSESERVAVIIKINQRVVLADTQILHPNVSSLISANLNFFALCDFDNLDVFSRTQAKNLHNNKFLRNGTGKIINILHLVANLDLVRINSHAKLAPVCFPDVITCNH